MLTAGRFMVNKVIPIAEVAVDGIADIYKGYGTLEYVAEDLITAKDELYIMIAQKYVDLLHKSDLRGYDYDAEDFLSDFYVTFQTFDLDELCKNIINFYNKLANKKLSAEYKRDFRKATRTKMYGNSLGTSAVAGTFNLLNYAAHTVFNAVDGAITDSNIDDKMDYLYEEYETEVYECTYSDVYNMGILFCAIAGYDDFYIRNRKRAVKIQRAIDKGEVPKNKLRENVAKVLYFQPQEKDNYIWAFNLLGDDYFKLIKYAELFEQKKAAKEIYGAMAELEVQKKKKQQELKLKAEKVRASNQRQEKLKSVSQKMFGDKAAEIDKRYANNKFYPIFLDTTGGVPADEFCKKICNSLEKYSKYTKYIWSREVYHFSGKLNELKEIFDKFKMEPPPDSEVILLVACDEYFKTILFTEQKIYFVNMSDKPSAFSYNEIKSFQFVQKESVMTYNDYINVNGKDVMSVEFDEDVFKTVKDIVEIFKLKNFYMTSKLVTPQYNFSSKIETATAETKPQISIEELKAYIRDNYKFDTYVYYNYAYDDKAQKKFRAALESYAKLSADEIPLVLFDSTFFGNAKDGFILTNKGFYSHGIGINEKFIPYEHLGVASDTKKENKIIRINSVEIDTVALKDEDIQKLVQVIRKCRDYFTTQPAKNSVSPKVEKSTENFPTTWEEWADEKNISNNSQQKNDAKDVESFLSRLMGKYKFDSHIYYFVDKDKKSQKKFKADLDSYVKLKSDSEKPLICCDATIFGSAKDGFVLTTKGIHIHNIGQSDPTFINYGNLTISRNGEHVMANTIEIDTGSYRTEYNDKVIELINACRSYFLK